MSPPQQQQLVQPRTLLCYHGATGEKTAKQNLTEKCKQCEENGTTTPVAGIYRWQLFYELASGFNRCLVPEKERCFSKLSRRGVQDVGLRQRGLGGIPVVLQVKLDS
ncbi:hypothetical protein NQZ68_009126 [Dissostichus eleginoides]|nr:hypothetical protein NQZ68_009126 [Dissostichus eleginoides]